MPIPFVDHVVDHVVDRVNKLKGNATEKVTNWAKEAGWKLIHSAWAKNNAETHLRPLIEDQLNTIMRYDQPKKDFLFKINGNHSIGGKDAIACNFSKHQHLFGAHLEINHAKTNTKLHLNATGGLDRLVGQNGPQWDYGFRNINIGLECELTEQTIQIPLPIMEQQEVLVKCLLRGFYHHKNKEVTLSGGYRVGNLIEITGDLIIGWEGWEGWRNADQTVGWEQWPIAVGCSVKFDYDWLKANINVKRKKVTLNGQWNDYLVEMDHSENMITTTKFEAEKKTQHATGRVSLSTNCTIAMGVLKDINKYLVFEAGAEYSTWKDRGKIEWEFGN